MELEKIKLERDGGRWDKGTEKKDSVDEKVFAHMCVRACVWERETERERGTNSSENV